MVLTDSLLAMEALAGDKLDHLCKHDRHEYRPQRAPLHSQCDVLYCAAQRRFSLLLRPVTREWRRMGGEGEKGK